ncbi:MAG: hypothetical protein KF862_16675 [Chitinophagaceae bacterium]|nr:hypothetical protein [Chitinophagaceae bacterium]
MKIFSPGSKWVLTAGVALLCMVMQQVQAQRRPVTYTQTLSGADGSLARDSSRTVIDSIFFDEASFDPVDSTTLVNNLVVFYIDETSLRMPPDSFKADLELRIYFTNKDSIYDSIASRTLTIEYFKNKPYNSRSVYYFTDARRVMIKVLDITASYAALNNILPVLKVENRMAVGRIFSMDCENDAITSLTQNTGFISTKGELQVSWPSLNAAEEYDLEWTFVDQTALDAGWYSPGSVLSPNLLFRNNATRVTVSKCHYFIPLLYEGDGRLFYRVRAAQTTIEGERKVTAWSSDHAAEGGLGEYVFTGHERSLNWQASTSFAEEGKRKSVVQYFDGYMRNRQTVTKDNVTDTSIVAETFYDKQGRSVIQVLPAPSLNAIIQYNPLFNQGWDMNTATVFEYHQGKYDTLTNGAGYCEDHAPPLATASGASKYYSPQNQNKNELIHRYIPDAEMYPYTEVKYTQDNTGRIASQGGVGPQFQLSGGHETKYYYGTPAQQELDALFGTEAGYASHYQKNMVRDANGQYSVSYVDMHGRTVATALTGPVPDSLLALPSYTSATQTGQLLTRNNNIVRGNSIESVSGLLVSVADTHTFRYKLNPGSLLLKDKEEEDICYDCLYDVTITITDDCNNQHMPGDTAYVYRKSNVRVTPPLYDTTCNAVADSFDLSFDIVLQPGSYVVTKKLTLREDAMNWYRDSLYAPHNTIYTKEQIIAQQLERIREQRGSDCVQEGEPWYEYQQYRERMLLDMTPPLGQYAHYPNSNTQLSIFNISGGRLLYKTADYSGLDQAVNPLSMDPEQYLNNFEPEWAERLLPLHPEYGILLEYEKLKPGYHWDADFEATGTYAAAAAKGYLNPLNSNTAPASGFSNGNDSLFYGGSNSGIMGSLKSSMESYVTSGGATFNLWSLASIMGHCDPNDETCINLFRNTPSNAFSGTLMCEGERDMAWRFFRDQYLKLKGSLVAGHINTVVPRPVITPPAVRVFVTESMIREIAGDFLGDDGTAALQAGKDSSQAIAERSCENYVSHWWQQLSSCSYSSADSAWLIPRLIEICKEGADASHPFGASSVRPESGYVFRSFDELITYYNNSIHKPTNAACNAFLIDAPVPYSKPVALVEQLWYSRPDDETCDRISSLRAQYEASSGYASFSDFLEQKLHTTISAADLGKLDSLCNRTLGCKFITEPVKLPPALQPASGEAVCVDCNQVNAVYTSFKSSFPGSIPTYEQAGEQQQQTNSLFSNYMNSRLGFSKTAIEYLQFLDTCGVSGLTKCDSIALIQNNFARDSGAVRWEIYSVTSYLVPVDLQESWTGGALRLPEKYRDSAVTTTYRIYPEQSQSFCFADGFSIEFRAKNPEEFNPPGSGGDITLGIGSDIYLNYHRSGNYTQLRHLKMNNTDIISPSIPGSPITVDSGYAFNDWHVFKLRMRYDSTWLYYDDDLVTRVVTDANIVNTFNTFYNVGLSIGGRQGSLDYFRLYNNNNLLVYNEEFENFYNKETISPAYLCGANNCTQRFTNYYNQQKGTSYTYNQIDSVYLSTCGKTINICSGVNSDSAGVLLALKNAFLDTVLDRTPIAYYQGNYDRYPNQEIIQSTTELVRNGILGDPDRYADSIALGYSHLTYKWPACNWSVFTKKRFSVEAKIRMSHSGNIPIGFSAGGIGGYADIIYYQGSYRLYSSFIYLSIKDASASPIITGDLPSGINVWTVIKVRYDNGKYQIYANGELLTEYESPGITDLVNAFDFGFFPHTDAAIDWVKIYGEYDELLHVEDFDQLPLKKLPPELVTFCEGTGCQETFRNYFNQSQGTSYTYNQINAIYNYWGIDLDVCRVPDATLKDTLKLIESNYTYKVRQKTPKVSFIGNDANPGGGEQIIGRVSEIWEPDRIKSPARYLDSSVVGYNHILLDFNGQWDVSGYNTFSSQFDIRVNYTANQEIRVKLGEFYAFYKVFYTGGSYIIKAYRLGVGTTQFNSSEFPVDTLTGVSDINVPLKMRYNNGVYQFYIRSKLIAEYASSERVSPVDKIDFSYSGDLQVSADLLNFYIWGENDNLLFAEHFYAGTPPVLHPDLIKPFTGVNDQSLFTGYFNSFFSTSFTGAQVDSIYFANGVFINVYNEFSTGFRDSLSRLVDSFYLDAKPGRVLHSRTPQDESPIYDLKQIVQNGIVVLPDSIRNLPGTWYNNYQVNFSDFCTSNGYTVTTRFKYLQNSLSGDLFYLGYRSIQAVFVRSSSGLVINSVTLYGYDGGSTEEITTNIVVDSNPDVILEWMTIKGVVKPSKVELYFNGVKVFEHARDSARSISNHLNFGLGLRGRHGAIDWIRVGDVNDSTKYFEDYNYINRMATVDESFICNGATDCQLAFKDYFNLKRGTSYTYVQIDSIYKRAGVILDACGEIQVLAPSNLLLCGKNESSNPALSYDDIYDPPCSDSSILAFNSGTEIYNAYKDSLDQGFNSKYAAKCLGAASMESFSVSHPLSEYHYTLYYYDQAGNLVKTIPPLGVNANRDSAWLAQVGQKRDLGETQTPAHTLPTVYRYNSLNQVVSQQTPDAGKSTNWYDRLGRLAVSRNAQQAIDGKYSYTIYDSLSRIAETGQKPQPTAMTNTISRDPQSLFDWIYYNNGGNTYGAEMVTRTVYDEASIDGTPCVTELQFTQKPHTLRNRVSYTRYFEKPSYTYNSQYGKYFITGISYTSGIDYSYDIHGNVDTMRNLYGSNTYSPMTYHGANACKTIAYTYDLVSGKVNEVHYNPGQNDEFYHRYEYDAENRLTDVYTTDNKIFLYQQGLEEHEARYQYYKHGPLARTVIGQQQVQGIDYTYTLQGWLKGINGNSTTPAYDPGGDGRAGANPYVAADAIGITLRYFTNDYRSVNSSAPNPFPAYAHKLTAGTYKPLYNGNITATTVFAEGLVYTQLYNYRYDQLNRLIAMDTYRNFNAGSNHWNSMAEVFFNKERYTYDANGNILTATRRGNLNANQLMDSLYYHYDAGTNRLNHVRDYGVTAYGINTDLKDQDPGNYQYDAIGNLKSAANRVLNSIKWNVYGKIVEINKGAISNATSQHIYYNYDPSGNRIGQFFRFRSPSNALYSYTWYVRDAGGNVLAVYKVEDVTSVSAGTLKLAEHHMYGSSRLGIINRNLDADQPKHTAENINQLGDTYLINFTRGNKFFEIANHLGNVMLTVTDKREPVPVSGNPSVIASYKADVMTAADYSPFGMTLPGRAYNNHWQKYRYGFNGKESDSEVNGPYNELDYGNRVYEPRLGRFLSVDPLTKDFPSLTPYQYASNSPIENSDLDGLESLSQIKANLEKQWRAQIEVKNSLEQRNSKFIEHLKSSQYQSPMFQFGTPPSYSPEQKEIKDAQFRAYLRNNGYNDDGSKPAAMRLMDSKTFNKFADNIALPILDVVTLAYGGAELRTLMLGLRKTGEIAIKVDLMGGSRSTLGKNWLNYDIKAMEGIRADVADFSKFFPKGSVSEMVVNNPQAPFLTEVSESMARGSTMTIRGQMANNHFGAIFNAEEIKGFEIIGRRTGLSKEGYNMSTGAPLRGGENSINEIILKKK